METVLLKIRRKKTVMELREIIIPILQEKADRAAAVTPAVREMRPAAGADPAEETECREVIPGDRVEAVLEVPVSRWR